MWELRPVHLCHLDPERNLAIDQSKETEPGLSPFWSCLFSLKGPQENRYRILKVQPVPGGNGSLWVMQVKSPPQPHGYGNWLGSPLDSLQAWPRWDSWALVGLPSAWLKLRKDPLKKSRGGSPSS